ncbi:MAG: glycosyl hydrolase family 79 C-terminal domain-containing protein [Solirubrobacteraceae bacterium]
MQTGGVGVQTGGVGVQTGGVGVQTGMRWRLAAGLAAGLVVAGLAVALVAPGRRSSRGDPPLQLDVTVATGARGRAIASGFLGLSFEFGAIRAYTGSDPKRVNPVLVQLIRNLTPGQAPVLRIGGDSTDQSYAPAVTVAPPHYVAYQLTPGWMATTAALAHVLGARMILGLNLAADEPALDVAEARDYLAAFGRKSIEALEIGNEPNVYHKLKLLHTALGRSYRPRSRDFGFRQYQTELDAIAAAVVHVPLAGPALAIGPTPSAGSWVGSIPELLARQHRIQILTVHRYPLRNCYESSSSPQYPTVGNLLSGYATSTLADTLIPWVAIAHDQHRVLRVDELNSVACRGRDGVSNTFASSLWVTDALFALANVGVDGVDMHTLPGSAYQLFSFSDDDGRWQGHVAPVYYGLQLFAQAAPSGSRLLTVRRSSPAPGVSIWATRAPDDGIRVTLINKDQSRSASVALRMAPGTTSSARVERLRAPSAGSYGDVTLGGRTYGALTSTGRLAPQRTQPIRADRRGAYVVSVPKASAALVTFSPPRPTVAAVPDRLSSHFPSAGSN